MATSDAPAARSRIFISYRREDTELAASRLADDLPRHFVQEPVFQDFVSIDPGADFVEAVQRGLNTCAAVLVVISPGWLGASVFPGLVGEADMPGAEDLPPLPQSRSNGVRLLIGFVR